MKTEIVTYLSSVLIQNSHCYEANPNAYSRRVWKIAQWDWDEGKWREF